MRHVYKALVLGGLALSLCGFCLGQSPGDVAREQRQKQQTKENKPAAKVITNELPAETCNPPHGATRPTRMPFVFSVPNGVR
jgi:hypothetical protein